MLKRLSGGRVVEHLLERRVDALRLSDFLHTAVVVPGVPRCRDLGAQDQLLDRSDVRQTLIAFEVLEYGVERPKR